MWGFPHYNGFLFTPGLVVDHGERVEQYVKVNAEQCSLLSHGSKGLGLQPCWLKTDHGRQHDHWPSGAMRRYSAPPSPSHSPISLIACLTCHWGAGWFFSSSKTFSISFLLLTGWQTGRKRGILCVCRWRSPSSHPAGRGGWPCEEEWRESRRWSCRTWTSTM